MTPRWLRVVAIALVAVTVAACSKSAQDYYAAGERFAAEGKLPEAILEYRNALSAQVNYPEAQLKLAGALVQVGDQTRALPEFVKAADLWPRRPDVQVRAGSLLLLARRFDEAKARADRALAIEPGRVEALVLRANALTGLSDVEHGLEEMERAIAIDPQAAFYTNLGTLRAAHGDRADAEAAFERAVAIDPKSVNARLALGNYLWAAGRLGDAESTLKAAQALDPANALANRALSTFYLAANRSAEAEPFLVRVAGASQAPGPKLALANYYASIGRSADATRVLEDVAKQPRTWAVARARLAALSFADGRLDEAGARADEVLVKEPKHAEALLVKTRVLLARGRADQALVTVQQAIASNPESGDGPYLLGTILATRGDIDGAVKAFNDVLRLNPRAAIAYVQLARLELLRGAPSASAQMATNAIAQDPENAVARLILVRALLAQRRVAEAEPELARLVKAYPQAAPVQVQLGLLRLQKRDERGGRAALQAALALDASAQDALAALTALDLRQGQGSAARGRLAERIGKAPADANLRILDARAALAMRQPDQAIVQLRAAIESEPNRLEAYALLTDVYLAQGKLDEARAECDAVAARQPRHVSSRTLAAVISEVQGHTADAVRRYEQIVKLDPRAAVASNNLAWQYAQSGTNLGTALQLAQAAQAQLPGRPEVLDTVGEVYLRQGQPAQAVAPLREAVERAPGNPVYQARLGLALAASGQEDAARRELEAALKAGDAFPGAAEAKAALAKLPAGAK